AVLQPPHRRVRRLARESRALLARDDRAVKDAVGDDCAIAVRISADMFIGEAGTQLERDVLPFVQIVDHLVDVWDVNVSGISEWGEDATPSRFYPQGRLLPWQAAVKSVSRSPCSASAAGRIPTRWS